MKKIVYILMTDCWKGFLLCGRSCKVEDTRDMYKYIYNDQESRWIFQLQKDLRANICVSVNLDFMKHNDLS